MGCSLKSRLSLMIISNLSVKSHSSRYSGYTGWRLATVRCRLYVANKTAIQGDPFFCTKVCYENSGDNVVMSRQCVEQYQLVNIIGYKVQIVDLWAFYIETAENIYLSETWTRCDNLTRRPFNLRLSYPSLHKTIIWQPRRAGKKS